ncbi:hypothetical protein F6X40_17655 [Paraburkholderia sp. UCT31]|uniref:hypothetical protein n=1 Tax=Paraburkholderia sp. UCT31 TaxID=2615209 RepID=UPI001655A5E1|nr:hypothetical protein [Paraburkholderia sp. UCT31]MBC8738587.1 hypothetical protein [Paraburkholderia sp. UCT31]
MQRKLLFVFAVVVALAFVALMLSPTSLLVSMLGTLLVLLLAAGAGAGWIFGIFGKTPEEGWDARY